MRVLRLAACLLCVTACSRNSITAPDAPFERQVVLAPGEAAAVPEASLVVRFDGVLGDSRCPADALCITGGDAIVRIVVAPDRGSRATYDLHTGDLRPARHDTLSIELVDLSPYPFSTRQINPADYRATLRLRR